MLRKKSVGGLLPVLMGLALIAAPLVLTGCPGGSDAVRAERVYVYEYVADADNVDRTGQTIDLVPNGTVQLVARVFPTGAPQGVNWSSSDDDVATVSEAGLVTAVAVGEPVTITATSRDRGDRTAYVTIVVAPPVDPGDPAVVVARTALGAAITLANARVQGDYTPATWTPFYAALTAAQVAYANAALGAAALNTARTNLETAMGNLIVAEVDVTDPAIITAREALAAAIELAEARVEANYTEESWPAFAAALAAAIAVYENAGAPLGHLNTARTDLEDAMAALVVFVDPALVAARNALADAITAATTGDGAPDEEDYTEDSWTAFYEALADAIAMRDNPEATIAQLNAARDALAAARGDLIPQVLETARALLAAAVAAALERDVDDYTVATWTPFYAALTAAQTALTNWRDLTPGALNSARETLEEAMDGLLTPRAAAIEALDAALAQAYSIYNDGIGTHDADYWTAFVSARNAAIAARALYATAPVADLELARDNLVAAIADLLGAGEASVTIGFGVLTNPVTTETVLDYPLAVGDTITVANPGEVLSNIRWYRGATFVTSGVLAVDAAWSGTTQLLTVRATRAGITYSLTVRFVVE